MAKREVRKPYKLPEESCERLTARQLVDMKLFYAFENMILGFKESFADRLDCVPYGKERLNMAYGGLHALLDDLMGTITEAQKKAIESSFHDYVAKLVPVYGVQHAKVILNTDQLENLLNSARLSCVLQKCTEDGNNCRKCQLYQTFESVIPLNNYGDSLICPYYCTELEDQLKDNGMID